MDWLFRQLERESVCKGSGQRVPYYDVRNGVATCPECRERVAVTDDRDGSVFTVKEHRGNRA